MGYGLGEQLEADLWKQVCWCSEEPWKIQKTMWRRWNKKAKVRRERRRARQDPECIPQYNRYRGWLY